MPTYGPLSARAEASRRNGAKSRGPKTLNGKARSSRNALKHGLRAQKHMVLPDEDAAEFEALEASLIDELAPDGVLQTLLVKRIAASAWRMGRAERIEVEIFAENALPDGGPGLSMIRDANRARAFETLVRYRAGTLAEFWRSLRTLKALQSEALSRAAAASRAEAAAPQAKVAAPQARVAAPQAEVAAPQAEVAAPQARVAAPQAEVTAPQAEVAAPQARVAAPPSQAEASQVAKPLAELAAPRPKAAIQAVAAGQAAAAGAARRAESATAAEVVPQREASSLAMPQPNEPEARRLAGGPARSDGRTPDPHPDPIRSAPAPAAEAVRPREASPPATPQPNEPMSCGNVARS